MLGHNPSKPKQNLATLIQYICERHKPNQLQFCLMSILGLSEVPNFSHKVTFAGHTDSDECLR